MTTISESANLGQERGVAIISFGRDYGSGDGQLLADTEDRLLRELGSDCGGLLLDLEYTSYAGCGFLSVLLRCYLQAKERGIRFGICTLSVPLARMLAVSRLDSLWEIFPTRGEAVVAMKQQNHAATCKAPFHTEEQ